MKDTFNTSLKEIKEKASMLQVPSEVLQLSLALEEGETFVEFVRCTAVTNAQPVSLALASMCIPAYILILDLVKGKKEKTVYFDAIEADALFESLRPYLPKELVEHYRELLLSKVKIYDKGDVFIFECLSQEAVYALKDYIAQDAITNAIVKGYTTMDGSVTMRGYDISYNPDLLSANVYDNPPEVVPLVIPKVKEVSNDYVLPDRESVSVLPEPASEHLQPSEYQSTPRPLEKVEPSSFNSYEEWFS